MRMRHFAAAAAVAGVLAAVACPVVTGKVAWVEEHHFTTNSIGCTLTSTIRFVEGGARFERTFRLSGQSGGAYYGGYAGELWIQRTEDLDGHFSSVTFQRHSTSFAMYDTQVDSRDTALRACAPEAEARGMDTIHPIDAS